MTLQEFIDTYDYEGSIVLLEGKRQVLTADATKLIALGVLLAQKTRYMVFRSGNASGADEYFSQGVAKIDKNRLHVIVPYSTHRTKANYASQTYSLDDIDVSHEPAVLYESKSNKKTDTLIDKYVAGERNQFAIKAAYIIRDTIKVLGTKGIPPATFGIFYDDLNNPNSGGTGHTMRVCTHNHIPQINQTTWFQWIDESML